MSPLQLLERSVGGGSVVRRSQLGIGHASAASVTGPTMVAVSVIESLLAVMSGVEDVKQGRVYDLGSFAQFAEDDK